MHLHRTAGIMLAGFFTFTWASFSPANPSAAAEADPQTVGLGKKVSIEYTVTDEKEQKIDSNVGNAPLVYTHGTGEILPALQGALLGMRVGASKQVTLKPEEAYGTVNPEAFIEVDKALVPENLRKVGNQLIGRGQSGQMQRFKVHEIKQETIVLDFNHPLAGKILIFSVKILKIE